jgi:hypothetical protein
MAQIQKGQTFADGDLVTGVKLNNIVDNASLNPEAITDQTPVSGYDVQGSDYVLIYDNSATALRKASIADILNSSSGNTIRTTTINGVSGYGIAVSVPSGQVFAVNGNSSFVGSGNSFSGDVSINGISTLNGATVINSTIAFNGSTITGNATLNGNIVIGAGKTLTLDSAPTLPLHSATKAYVDSVSSLNIKAFAKFAGSTGTYSGAKNIASITKVTTGTYNVVFTTPMANTDYIINSNCTNNGSSSGWVTIYNQTTTGFQAYTAYPVSFGGGQLPYDPTAVFFTVISN